MISINKLEMIGKWVENGEVMTRESLRFAKFSIETDNFWVCLNMHFDPSGDFLILTDKAFNCLIISSQTGDKVISIN